MFILLFPFDRRFVQTRIDKYIITHQGIIIMIHIIVCMRMRACVSVCVRTCVRVRVYARAREDNERKLDEPDCSCLN